MSAHASPAGARSLDREWWLRTLAVLQAPRAVFSAFRHDSDEEAEARQEPVLALVALAGVAAILAWSPTTGTLMNNPNVDGVLVAVLTFLAGVMYGAATYWLGGAALYVGARGAGGRGSYRRARHVLAFSAAPLVLSLVLLWPLRLALYGAAAFRTGGADEHGAGHWAFTAADLTFVGWSLALLLVGLSVVQRWSLVRAAGALVIAAFALLAFTFPFVIPLASR
jgi:hypothetical protein